MTRGLDAQSLGSQPRVKEKSREILVGMFLASDGREIGQTAEGFQTQHMRSACRQQIRGMSACTAEEKCIHPSGKGEARRWTAVERK